MEFGPLAVGFVLMQQEIPQKKRKLKPAAAGGTQVRRA